MLQNLAINSFLRALKQMQYGTLSMTTPDGKTRTFKGKDDGPNVTFSFKTWKVITNLIVNGDTGFAEDYQKELWDTDDLPGLLYLALLNENSFEKYVLGSHFSRFFSRIMYWFRRNTVDNSKKNIQAHYDLGNDFYTLWLDPTMTYSSALYKDQDDLKQAQINKYQRILDQLHDNKGALLEIGCGWGGMAEQAVAKGIKHYKGITLSTEQHDYAQERIGDKGAVVIEDYRNQTDPFDHIVSIEMFEAVGEAYWPTYFETIKRCLKPDGRAVVQTITIENHRFETYKRGADMIRTYIFPGGMLPSPDVFADHVAQTGLKITDTFSFGQDYARTLLKWLEQFDAQRDAVIALGFDDKFIKLWRFYLAACYAGFKAERTDVVQYTMEHA